VFDIYFVTRPSIGAVDDKDATTICAKRGLNDPMSGVGAPGLAREFNRIAPEGLRRRIGAT